ncbi:RloB domain-containing protein [Klebsiella pneumoniae]|uniref:RloB domain-containing protein n=2 Tax=Klebsiella pneumoniae TaxID=573 RepID=UPI000DE99D44|nr:RloB domain-containing protein [Klebsiella pneumoniae]EKZ6502222.1 RloB domain-containing protein [Klebsiella variicola]MBS8212382.1 RloB domain-containing protein [Klebsiella pneumoniae]MBS8244500.1 RloB domain-containing protein [Klebsiella pneumoniae]MCK8441694.1 RloB domain-containing protein [Klebsiella pneumoniae subsp. pneumoniae]MCW8231352.1 RloB domain-containing protein [Klebsiella pneumoniae]
MAKRKVVRRSVTKTLLLVGEGHAEKAFLSHLKSLFSNGSFKVSIVTAGGKGPEHVMSHAISCKRCDGYDFVIVLLDTDIVWPKENIRKATSAGINLIGSDPCLEGLLLDVLGRKKGTTNQSCKDLLHPLLNGPCTERDSYATLFTADVLDSTDCKKLKLIIDMLRGKEEKSVII